MRKPKQKPSIWPQNGVLSAQIVAEAHPIELKIEVDREQIQTALRLTIRGLDLTEIRATNGDLGIQLHIQPQVAEPMLLALADMAKQLQAIVK